MGFVAQGANVEPVSSFPLASAWAERCSIVGRPIRAKRADALNLVFPRLTPWAIVFRHYVAQVGRRLAARRGAKPPPVSSFTPSPPFTLSPLSGYKPHSR